MVQLPVLPRHLRDDDRSTGLHPMPCRRDPACTRMRPVKVSKAEADAILANARARGIAFPKPVPVKRDGIYKLKLRAQIRAVSAKARKRIGEWSALRDGVVARDSGVCQFCGGEHQKLTAHHVIPRANGGDDVETNLVTIGITVRGFGGCHASAHADLRSSKMILLRKLGHA